MIYNTATGRHCIEISKYTHTDSQNFGNSTHTFESLQLSQSQKENLLEKSLQLLSTTNIAERHSFNR